MKKYDEIMEQIQVTDEMKNRILSNIDHQLPRKKKPLNASAWLSVMGSAAAAVFVICGIALWNSRSIVPPPVSNPSSDLAQGIYHMQEYASASELSAATGFPITELKSLPFTVLQTGYMSIGSDLAEIEYSGNDESETLVFRKSRGTEENSGDYTVYSTVDTVKAGSATVTLKGNGERISLASWTDGQYAYSIGMFAGCSRENMLQLISEAMEKGETNE